MLTQLWFLRPSSALPWPRDDELAGVPFLPCVRRLDEAPAPLRPERDVSASVQALAEDLAQVEGGDIVDPVLKARQVEAFKVNMVELAIWRNSILDHR